MRLALACLAAWTVVAQGGARAQTDAASLVSGPQGLARPVISLVRVHGNHTTPDEEVLRLAAVQPGQPLPDGGVEAVAARLEASRRFRRVEVRVRQRSIHDSADVALVILVEEHPVPSKAPVPAPMRWLRSTGAGLMWLPILDYTDAYGFTYGARFTFAGALGGRSRVSFPLTWGGTREASVELERGIGTASRASLKGGFGVWQREHPYYDVDERRTEGWVGAAVPIKGPVRVDPRVGWALVRFDQQASDLFTAGADLVIDTRLNPALPRNAVNLRLGVESVKVEGTSAYLRSHADLRAYLGLHGTVVLALRGRVEDTTAPQPPFMQPWLGGASSLRGVAPGAFAGDRLLAASAELRLPLNSPMNVGTLGVAAFADVGAVGPHGQPFSSMSFTPSAGAGVFLALPFFTLNLDVAYAFGHGTRAHVSTGVQF